MKRKFEEDLVKFWLAIHYDTCPEGFYTADYIKEKIEKILDGSITWHANIDGQDCQKALKYIKRANTNALTNS